MSDKINIKRIVIHHNSTIQDDDGNPIFKDYLTLYLVPLIVAFLWVISGANLSNSLVTIIVTSASIFAGLMFNLLILINEKRSRLPTPLSSDENYEMRAKEIKVVEETYYNISFTILSALMCTFCCIFYIGISEISNSSNVFTSLIDIAKNVIGASLITTTLITMNSLLMILKRSFNLFNDITFDR
jgi:hypothetical protein